MTSGQSATIMLPKHTKTSGPSSSATSHVCSQGGSSPRSEGGGTVGTSAIEGKGGEGGGDTGGEEEGVEAAVGSDALSWSRLLCMAPSPFSPLKRLLKACRQWASSSSPVVPMRTSPLPCC